MEKSKNIEETTACVNSEEKTNMLVSTFIVITVTDALFNYIVDCEDNDYSHYLDCIVNEYIRKEDSITPEMIRDNNDKELNLILDIMTYVEEETDYNFEQFLNSIKQNMLDLMNNMIKTDVKTRFKDTIMKDIKPILMIETTSML